MTRRHAPPQYDTATVEALLLEVAAELHPRRAAHMTGTRVPI
jgi:hypothetical protein